MSTLRIAVTGLKGAGKTVFLTSLINNLIRGTSDSFQAFKKRGVIFTADPQPLSPARRRFPYSEYLRQFRKKKPEWPRSTVDVSEFRVTLEIKKKSVARIDLHLVDYPGERLLDMPLLDKTFEQWSDQTLDESERPLRDELSEPWKQACAEIEDGSDDFSDTGKRAVAAYHQYLLACRDKGLQFLQPSAAVLPTEGSEFLDMGFCPLPARVREGSPALVDAFAKRYEAYKESYVKPFVAEVARCSRQIVLVDVLRILRTGLHCFSDTQKCLEEILKVYSYSPSRPRYVPKDVWRLLTSTLSLGPRVDKVSFVATKCDLATRSNRSRLRALLEVLVRFAANRLRFRLDDGRIAYDHCAAFQCTEDVAKKLDDLPISVLKGRRAVNGTVKEGVWFPGEVPEEWPTESYDPEQAGYMFPVFMPKPLPRDRDDLPIAHLNLDELFYSIVEGYIR